MGCLFALFAGVFPRLALLMVWVARPKMVDAAFDSWIWPLHWGAGWTQRRQAPGYPARA